MINFFIFNVLFLLLDIIYPQFIMQLDPLFQSDSYLVEMKDQYSIDELIGYGIWSKYNPLSVISQVGPVGLFDSDCFHYQNIIEQNSGNLDLIYYDCLYPQSKTIQKFLSYTASDGQIYTYNLTIDPFNYENFWYLFQLLYWPFINKLELIIITQDQQLLHEILHVNPFKEKNIFVNFGSSLLVQNSNIDPIIIGSRYSYFPGTILLYVQGLKLTYSSPPDLDYINKARQDFYSNSDCFCKQNNQYQLLDQDLAWLDIRTFTSENINCDSFTFSGWYKIKEMHKIDDEFTYQFLRIMPNFENEQLSNPNLTPFQLFYKISSNNYKIIITTYSYKFPSVTLDFANNDNAFIITKEFEILHKITLWQNLLVKLVDDQMFISIKFYDSYDLYKYTAEFNVKQFHNVQFKLLYGNLQKSSLNYLDIQTRNQFFYNCQQQIEQQNCHYSCKDCDGPTKTDCLSCSEESSRIYLQEYKACICPYDYYDDQINQNCKSYTDLQLKINQIPIENGCKFGYFEFDDSCYACPSIISNQQITCIECLKNVQGWKQNPYCQTTVYINPNGNTAKTISDEDYFYYVFDGLESSMCRYCNQQSLSNIDSIYQDFNLLIQRFKSFCQLSKNYFSGTFDINICYECKILGCITCSIGITEIKCINCEWPWLTINGICTINSYSGNINDCLSPYYRNSIGECKLCNLKNCKYCFEYNKNDLSKCTLYANFDKFDLDEYLAIGCALCEDNFIFDFSIGECIYKQPSLSNCIRSYINQQNQEICTLSSTDFSIAPEIINCNKFIQNCLQCLFTPQSSLRCIICQSGFTSSIRLGSCYPNSAVNAKIVIEGDYYLQDAWVQRVQSFMMKFLPKQYYYQRAFVYFRSSGIELECNDGYQIDDQHHCKKYCTPECLNCQFSVINYRFYCEKCPLNDYYQPIRSEEFGQCTGCPGLCDICQERSEIEINYLNPQFKISEKNRKYTKKCIRPILNQNVLIDPYYQIAKYNYDLNSNSEFIFEYDFNNCDLYFQLNIDDKIDTNFFNQKGIAYLTLQMKGWFNIICYDLSLQFTTQLKSEIFYLQFLKLTINAFQSIYPSAFISNFDCIEINDVTFIFNNSQFFEIANQNQKVNLILNNVLILDSQIQNVYSLFDTQLFGDLNLNTIKIINTNFTNSSLINLTNRQFQGKIKVHKMIFQNCKFVNSQLFLFFNNQISIQIEQLVINQSQFYNSSFITINTNYAEERSLQVDGITVVFSELHQSYIFNCTTQNKIIINNLILDQNLIIFSTVIGFTSNFTLFIIHCYRWKQTSKFTFLEFEGIIARLKKEKNDFPQWYVEILEHKCQRLKNQPNDPFFNELKSKGTKEEARQDKKSSHKQNHGLRLQSLSSQINHQITLCLNDYYSLIVKLSRESRDSCTKIIQNKKVVYQFAHSIENKVIQQLQLFIYIYSLNQNLFNFSKSFSMITNSVFIYNKGNTGVALYSANVSIKIIQCKILHNRASFQGGGLYLDMNNKNLLIKESTIIYNQALEGGGIFMLKNENINQKNLIQSYLHFNEAEYFANNLVEFPTHLSLFINSQEMQTEEIKIYNTTIKSLLLKPYKIIEQGVSKMSSSLMVPSNQVLKDYQIVQSKTQKQLFNEFSISIRNSRNEFLQNIYQFSCTISQTTVKLNQISQQKDFKMIDILQADNATFDLSSLSFHYDPYQDENQNLYILINCSSYYSKKQLYYLIKARSYKCQLGEFYVDEGCQICESIYGFYSVTYNATKCSIFDKIKFENITSNSIQLLQGYWRPNLYSDYINFCFKNIKFCKGGWMVGNELCSMGHIGGLCEECDTHNIRGEGQFFKNQQDSHCYGCSNTANNIVSFIISSLWAIISILITLKSIGKSNDLFTQLKLKLKPKYSKILFKLDQDLESILIKILLNYLWIFSVIFTFNIKFSLSFTFIDQFSNTSQFMAFSLDCYLSDASQIELIYLRIFATIGIFLIQFIIILVGFKVYSQINRQKLDKSIISNTLLYLYVQNYAGLIKQFCSILSKRTISNNQYIQGDLTLIFGSQNHYKWIYYFAIPGLGIFGCCIPFSLFFLMLINKGKLEQIKLRRHICYLFNEYNERSYFWEQIKLSKKTIIILIMTYFESNILLKASLLGLFLLVYQLLAGKQQPYILSSLNNLDLQTGQICSIAIFVATAKYVSEQEMENSYSEILQVVIILLFLRLCYPFFFDIFRVYIKKYQVKMITLLYNIQKFINPDSRMANYFDTILKKWRLKENRLRTNFQILKLHLLIISKAQIKNQKSHLTIAENQNILLSVRHKQFETISNNCLLQLE